MSITLPDGTYISKLTTGLLLNDPDSVNNYLLIDSSKTFNISSWNVSTEKLQETIFNIVPTDKKVIIGSSGGYLIDIQNLSTSSDCLINTLSLGCGNGNSKTNTVFGLNSHITNSSGTNNTSIGNNSLRYNTIGINNTAIGSNCLTNNTTGTFNTAIGESSLNKNTYGRQNTALGRVSMNNNIDGYFNTSVGYASMYNSSGSYQNVSVGMNNLYALRNGYNNVSIGYNSQGIIDGNDNILIGANTNTGKDVSNVLMIGTTTGGIYGTNINTSSFKLGVNTQSPTGVFHTKSTLSTGCVVYIENTSSTFGNTSQSTGSQINTETIIDISASNTSSSSGTYNLVRAKVSNTNKFRIDNRGNVFGNGSFNTSGADYSEYFEEAGDPEAEKLQLGDPVILLQNGKVRCATINDDPTLIIGVVRSKQNGAGIVGNSAWSEWNNKYIKDEWGQYITEPYNIYFWKEIDDEGNEINKEGLFEPDIPEYSIITQQRYKLNPLYDESLEYTPRENRDEWKLIGLLGQVYHNKNKPKHPNWIKIKDVSENSQFIFIR